MRTHARAAVIVGVLLTALGCGRGYLSADAMESGQIGPRNCDETCSELGMQMGAFVLVQHSYAGCVCEPRRTAGGAHADPAYGAAVQAGATVAILEAQQQQQRRQQQQN